MLYGAKGETRMQYIDVRLRIPITKLGQLVQDLPDWAKMIGYDKLGEPKQAHHRQPNGEYKPASGSTIEAVFKRIARGPITRQQTISALKQAHNPQAISSAISVLAKRSIITQQKDGYYVVKE
jgi:hypothetical protein